MTEALGVTFTHRHFGTGEKYMPENMGSGIAIFDADGDARLDLYFVQGAPLGPEVEGKAAPPEASNRLFRQRPDGTFEDVTAASGAGHRGHGMGASFGDVDRDGDLDLFVTNFGPDVLLLNRGDGTFEDATARSGLGDSRWSTASGFFDPDGDGDLDLFVVRYVDFSFSNHKFCGNAQQKIRAYCHPDVYGPLPDSFYSNDGKGRFTEVSRQVGLLPTAEVPDTEGKGLGLAFGDFDGDGRLDAYVANDSTMNYLYLGDGNGRFRESALLAGLGFNGAGAAEASMGVEVGDLDGDGRAEIFLTHLDQETNTLYRPSGPGLWADVTDRAGLSRPSLPWVGFGTVLLDHDQDGDLDLFVANGHIIDNIALFDPSRSHRQPAQLFDNRGDGRFEEISGTLGLPEPLVGRGAARGDLDRDGDLDLVVTQNGGTALVLLNGAESLSPRRHSILVRLEGVASNPQGYGARLELTTRGSGGRGKGDEAKQAPAKRVLVREMASASSYLSQGAPEVHFGLGAAAKAEELVVRWPSGRVDRHPDLAADFLYTIREGAEAPTASFRLSSKGPAR